MSELSLPLAVIHDISAVTVASWTMIITQRLKNVERLHSFIPLISLRVDFLFLISYYGMCADHLCV
jgi:hypothetical protein